VKLRNARPTEYGWQFYTRIGDHLATEHFCPHELKNGHEPTQREIDDWVGKTRAIADGTVTPIEPSDEPTFADDVPVYLAQVRTMPTYAWRKADLDLWLPIVGHLPRSQITAGIIRTQLEAWRADGYAESTVNHRRTAIMHLYAILDGKSARNPARDVPRYAEPDLPPRNLSLPAVDAILATMPDDAMRARLVLMRWTGWPQAQIRTLTEQQIAWDEAVLLSRNKGRGVKPRWIPLLPEGWTALKRLRELKGFGAFENWALRSAFRRAAARARTNTALPEAVRKELANVTPYQLRHTFGTLVSGVTRDDRATMTLLIQNDVRQAQRYSKATVEPRAAHAIASVAKSLATLATSSGESREQAGSAGTAKRAKSRKKPSK
jgi:integrase